VKLGEEKLVQEVFTSTWSFLVNFLPRMEIQQALVAMSNGQPLATVLMNNYSGSLDLGVQVVSDHRRKHVGSLLVREALHYYRDKGFEHMYVIRNLPVNGLRPEDEIALQFYASTGAFPLREYVGFQPG
jgi:GNAT superfamily N-acetyltransferase